MKDHVKDRLPFTVRSKKVQNYNKYINKQYQLIEINIVNEIKDI